MSGDGDNTGDTPAPKRSRKKGAKAISDAIDQAQPFVPETPRDEGGEGGADAPFAPPDAEPVADTRTERPRLSAVPDGEAQIVMRLADLDDIQYDRVRKAEAKALNITVGTLDKLVKLRRGEVKRRDDERREAQRVRRMDDGGPPRTLPDDIPIQPLGRDGERIYFIDADGFLQGVDCASLKDTQLVLWFGGVDDLMHHWPKFDKDGNRKTWDHTPPKEALIESCRRAGPFSPEKMVRGRGCWATADGQLVMHCGNVVYVGDVPHDPGKIGDHIYPLGASIIAPPRRGAGDEPAKLYARLKTWKWARGDLDAHLMFGWIVAGMLGGAIKWRPMTWLTGDKGTGKSTLQSLVNWLMGGGVVQAVNTTAAGVYQHIGMDSVPVALDELEAGGNNQRQQQIMELARQASSGGVMLRGGAAHQGVEFRANSAFFFSSINIPPMKGQDISRMSILELMPLGGAAEQEEAGAEARWRAIGQAIRWKLIEQWPRWHETLHHFQRRLKAVGHNERDQDQFGTLLACADLVLANSAPDDDAPIEDTDFVTLLDARALASHAPNLADWELLLQHLSASVLDVFKGGTKLMLGQWVQRLVEPDRYLSDSGDGNAALANFGMRVVQNPHWTDPASKDKQELTGHYIAVAYQHRMLGTLLADTNWSTLAEASQGGWVRPLLRAPDTHKAKMRIARNGSEWCVLVPVEAMLGRREEGEK